LTWRSYNPVGTRYTHNYVYSVWCWAKKKIPCPWFECIDGCIILSRYYECIIFYFIVFIRIGHAGGCFLKRCGDRVIGVTHRHTHTHTYTYTYNGFTPDTRRVVGRPGSALREVSVRSTGFHYPWTGRRQPGGTLEQEVYKQREIRLASEPVGTAIVTCTTAPPADTVANGSTIPSDARHRSAWVSGETVIGACSRHSPTAFLSYLFFTYPLNTRMIKPTLVIRLFFFYTPPSFDLRTWSGCYVCDWLSRCSADYCIAVLSLISLRTPYSGLRAFNETSINNGHLQVLWKQITF